MRQPGSHSLSAHGDELASSEYGNAESAAFDPVIHAPVRHRLCAALDQADEAEFSWVMEALNISKSALSKHVATLVEAGYLEQRRRVRDTRQRVWLNLTESGRQAYARHVNALRRIVGDQ